MLHDLSCNFCWTVPTAVLKYILSILSLLWPKTCLKHKKVPINCWQNWKKLWFESIGQGVPKWRYVSLLLRFWIFWLWTNFWFKNVFTDLLLAGADLRSAIPDMLAKGWQVLQFIEYSATGYCCLDLIWFERKNVWIKIKLFFSSKFCD